MVKKIILAKPRGFCAGVKRAIKTAELALEKYEKIYIKHEIVHNKHVVKALEEEGAITINKLEEVPENSTVIFSAHGSSPQEYELAKKRNLKVIDATCPLVTKVHLEAKKFAKEGYNIIYIGKEGHQEAIGVLAESSNIILISSIEDIHKLNFENNKIACLTQTTLNVNDTNNIIKALREKFPSLVVPVKEDICFSTTNRQEAVKELTKLCDVIIVVGSKNSSNSNKLVQLAKQLGKKAYLIDDLTELPELNADVLGITAGASAPEHLVKELINYFNCDVEELKIIEEDIIFSLPKIDN